MPKDAIDSMIESWATGQEAEASPEDVAEAAPNFNLDATPPATPLDAARAIQEAVRNDTGRRKHMKTWSAVAREALGRSRLSAKRYQGVLDAGYAAGLFRMDEDALSYPILVALDPEPEPEPEPEVEVEHQAPLKSEEISHVALFSSGAIPAAREARKAAATIASMSEALRDSPTLAQVQEDLARLVREGFIREEEGKFYQPEPDPPVHLACGHWNRQSIPDPAFPAPEIRGEVPHTLTVKVEQPGPEHCPACVAGRPGDPRYQVGEWRRPVAASGRRTPEKSDPSYPGFPGLCTDPETGFYIGGMGNDCSRYNKGKERCEYHAARARPRKRKKKGKGGKGV